MSQKSLLAVVFTLAFVLTLVGANAMAYETLPAPMRDGVRLSTGIWKSGGGSQQTVLFDTGIVELSQDGPLNPGGYYGNTEYQSHVPLPHFNWLSPVNYAEGDLYQRLDVFERPSLKSFRANQQVQQDGYNGDHWWPGLEWIEVTEPDVYTTSHDWQSMRDARGLLDQMDNPPPLRLAFAVQGAGGHPNSPWTDPDIFPMKVRITWVIV